MLIGSGLKVKSSCTTTLDTVCEPLEGFFCIDLTKDQCEAAQKHKDCDPGQYIKEKGWFLVYMRTKFEETDLTLLICHLTLNIYQLHFDTLRKQKQTSSVDHL